MILRRYLLASVLRPLAGILVFFFLLFLAWTSSRMISEGGAVSMTLGEFFTVLLLQAQVALEMMVPLAFFLAVISALGRMAAAQEFVALRAVGGQTRLLLSAVLLVALPLGGLIGAEAVYLRPLAYDEIFRLDTEIGSDINLERVEAGHFYTANFSGRVVFAAGRDGNDLLDVFVQQERDGKSEFIRAARARQGVLDNGREIIDFDQGFLYQMARSLDPGWQMNVGKLRLILDSEQALSPERRIKSLSSAELLGDPDLVAQAELQGRTTTPLITITLGLLAVVLSRYAPRRGRYRRLLFSLLVLVAYLNLYVIAKGWVKSGFLPVTPGLYALPLALLLIVVALLLLDQRRRWFARAVHR